ncbi:MAG: hypothetical protein HYW77_01950 [Parcubacteria group bacterium]|nr:hypothetical protein [Parcubacteria group bacterium]
MLQGFKVPKNNGKYYWTNHIVQKMVYYKISPSRVKRIIRAPDRVEESIVPGLVAAMKKFSKSAKEEIWAIYQVDHKKLKLISAWRYPGKSSERNPIPQEILREIKLVINLGT